MSRPNTPTYKTKNWPTYNEALKRRGEPLRVCRRLISVIYAAMGSASRAA